MNFDSPIQFVDAPCFHSDGADWILAPIDFPDSSEHCAMLSKAAEEAAFRQMNFLKCKAESVRQRIELTSDGNPADVQDLLARSLAIRNRIVIANIKLVAFVIKTRTRRWQRDILSFRELESSGCLQLIRSVDSHDFTKARFSTFAVPRIAWALNVACKTGLRAHERFRGEKFKGHLEGLHSSDDAVSRIENAEQVRIIVAKLSAREGDLLAMRYGLRGGSPMTFAEVGAAVGVSKQRVQQLEAVAIDKAREACEVRKSLRREHATTCER